MNDKPPSLLSVATFLIALVTLILVAAFGIIDDVYEERLYERLKVIEGRCQ